MNVTFYTFSKRINSTKLPSGGTSYGVTLKEGCSVLRPSIRLVWPGSGSPTAYNYAYISDFGRYYWVQNWTFEDRQWTADLAVDVLATYKTGIGSSSQYVTRSASQYDGDVTDGLYPAKATPALNTAQTALWNPPSNVVDQVFVMAIMGQQGWQSYYLLNGLQYAYIANEIFGSSFFNGYDFGDISVDTVKSWFSPEDNVVSVSWLPLSWSQVSGLGSSTPLSFGSWPVTGTYNQITPQTTFTVSGSIAITDHPDAATRGSYLNGNTYSARNLFIPGVGNIALDCDKLIGCASVNVSAEINLAGGSATFTIYAVGGSTTRIQTLDKQIAVPFGYGTTRMDGEGVFSAVLGAAGSAANENAAGTISGVIDAIKSAFPHTTVINSSGSIGAYQTRMRLEETFYRQTPMDNTDRGRPLCQIKTINTLSGYVKCEDANLSLSATDAELDAVVSYMNGGFFYE